MHEEGIGLQFLVASVVVAEVVVEDAERAVVQHVRLRGERLDVAGRRSGVRRRRSVHRTGALHILPIEGGGQNDLVVTSAEARVLPKDVERATGSIDRDRGQQLRSRTSLFVWGSPSPVPSLSMMIGSDQVVPLSSDLITLTCSPVARAG